MDLAQPGADPDVRGPFAHRRGVLGSRLRAAIPGQARPNFFRRVVRHAFLAGNLFDRDVPIADRRRPSIGEICRGRNPLREGDRASRRDLNASGPDDEEPMLHRDDASYRLAGARPSPACCWPSWASVNGRGDILYQTGFESPTFSPGALVGQGSFSELYGQSQQAAVVTTAAPASGSQAVSIDGGLLDSTAFPGFYTGMYSPLLRESVRRSARDWPADRHPPGLVSVDRPDHRHRRRERQPGGIRPLDLRCRAMWLSSDGHLQRLGADRANSFEQSVPYSAVLLQHADDDVELLKSEISYFFNEVFLGRKSFAADQATRPSGSTSRWRAYLPTGYTARGSTTSAFAHRAGQPRHDVHRHRRPGRIRPEA